MVIANCAKCNKPFQRISTALCSACQQASLHYISLIYRFIYDHPGQTTEAIAEQCQIPLKELETLLFSGKLGTAAQYVRFRCQRCHCTIPAVQQKGRFCPECTVKLDVKDALYDKEPEKPVSKPASEMNDARGRPAAGPIASHQANSTHAQAKPPKEASPPQKESASPSSESYGFKRSSEK